MPDFILWLLLAILVVAIIFLKWLLAKSEEEYEAVREYGEALAKELARLEEQNQRLEEIARQVAQLARETEALEKQIRSG